MVKSNNLNTFSTRLIMIQKINTFVLCSSSNLSWISLYPKGIYFSPYPSLFLVLVSSRTQVGHFFILLWLVMLCFTYKPNTIELCTERKLLSFWWTVQKFAVQKKNIRFCRMVIQIGGWWGTRVLRYIHAY